MPLSEFFADGFRYPVEYDKIIKELNKMDLLAIRQIYDLLKLINGKNS